MAERGEGVAAPNQRQGQKTKSTTEPTTAATNSRSSRTTTAFTHKLVKF